MKTIISHLSVILYFHGFAYTQRIPRSQEVSAAINTLQSFHTPVIASTAPSPHHNTGRRKLFGLPPFPEEFTRSDLLPVLAEVIKEATTTFKPRTLPTITLQSPPPFDSYGINNIPELPPQHESKYIGLFAPDGSLIERTPNIIAANNDTKKKQTDINQIFDTVESQLPVIRAYDARMDDAQVYEDRNFNDSPVVRRAVANFLRANTGANIQINPISSEKLLQSVSGGNISSIHNSASTSTLQRLPVYVSSESFLRRNNKIYSEARSPNIIDRTTIRPTLRRVTLRRKLFIEQQFETPPPPTVNELPHAKKTDFIEYGNIVTGRSNKNGESKVAKKIRVIAKLLNNSESERIISQPRANALPIAKVFPEKAVEVAGKKENLKRASNEEAMSNRILTTNLLPRLAQLHQQSSASFYVPQIDRNVWQHSGSQWIAVRDPEDAAYLREVEDYDHIIEAQKIRNKPVARVPGSDQPNKYHNNAADNRVPLVNAENSFTVPFQQQYLYAPSAKQIYSPSTSSQSELFQQPQLNQLFPGQYQRYLEQSSINPNSAITFTNPLVDLFGSLNSQLLPSPSASIPTFAQQHFTSNLAPNLPYGSVRNF